MSESRTGYEGNATLLIRDRLLRPYSGIYVLTGMPASGKTLSLKEVTRELVRGYRAENLVRIATAGLPPVMVDALARMAEGRGHDSSGARLIREAQQKDPHPIPFYFDLELFMPQVPRADMWEQGDIAHLLRTALTRELAQATTKGYYKNLGWVATDFLPMDFDLWETFVRPGRMVLLIDHYEALEDKIGKEALLTMEAASKTKIEPYLGLGRGPKIIIACDRDYFNRRRNLGLFQLAEEMRLEEPPIDRIPLEMIDGQIKHLREKERTLRYIKADSPRLNDMVLRLIELEVTRNLKKDN